MRFVTWNQPGIHYDDVNLYWSVEGAYLLEPGDPATGKQKDTLSKFGVDPGTISCKGQAGALLDKLFLRRDLGLASARQVLWLRKLGHPRPELATFEEAKQFLDAKWNKPEVAA